MLCVSIVNGPAGLEGTFYLGELTDRERLAGYLRDTLRERRNYPNCEPLAALSRAYLRCLRVAGPTGSIDPMHAKQIALQELRNERRTEFRRLLKQGEENDD